MEKLDEIVNYLNMLLEKDPLLIRQLLIPCAVTGSREIAADTPFVFSSPDNGRTWLLSALGFLNGVFSDSGEVIAAEVEEDGTYVRFIRMKVRFNDDNE